MTPTRSIRSSCVAEPTSLRALSNLVVRSRKQVRSICQMMNPAVIELLMQYLYEGEYAPMLPTDDADKTPGTTLTPQTTLTPRSKRGGKAATYTYEFPHTCCSYQNYCDYPQVCAHHTCESHCSYVCKAFNCNECNPPLLPKLDGTAEQLLVHAKLYELGDKYDVVGLKDIAKEKFDRACKHFWNTPTFAAAAHHAFSTTVEEDKGLRDIVSATISERIELVNDPGVSVLLTQFNGLALSILQAKIKELGWDKKS